VFHIADWMNRLRRSCRLGRPQKQDSGQAGMLPLRCVREHRDPATQDGCRESPWTRARAAAGRAGAGTGDAR
jgi:hypothetical protein